MNRPRRLASDYASEPHERVRSTLLYVATCLGDMIDDLVVVGGLVPSLLIRESELPDGAAPHVGTMDLDLGLTLGLFNDARYQGLISRLRDAGFRRDTNPRGNPAHQRWTMAEPISATVDFLIPPSLTDDQPGKLKHLAPDFAAIVTPGLSLAFRDRERVSVSGRTPRNEKATPRRLGLRPRRLCRPEGAGVPEPWPAERRLRSLLHRPLLRREHPGGDRATGTAPRRSGGTTRRSCARIRLRRSGIHRTQEGGGVPFRPG